jgi:hypothetical protein
MYLDSAALADWAVDKMGIPTERLCEILLGDFGIPIVSSSSINCVHISLFDNPNASIYHVAIKYGQLVGIDWSYERGYPENRCQDG